MMTTIPSNGATSHNPGFRFSGSGARKFLFTALAAILFAQTSLAADVAGTARLIRERRGHTATAIGGGKILVAGGQNLSGAIPDVEIFDAATGTFSVAARLLTPRAEHSATRLADGRVFLIGGRGTEALTSTEFFDPTRNVFSSGPALNSPRFGHTATLLPDGRVVVIGGNSEGTAEIFDPRAGTFSALPCRLTDARSFHAAVRLLDGSILIAGGIAADGATLRSAEVLHPDTLECEPIATMRTVRSRFALRLLPDGKVQAIGGDADSTMELFNPAGYFSSLVHLTRTAESESAALRNAGRVAIMGPTARVISDSPATVTGGREVRPVQSLLDRIDYSMTELPEAGMAIAAGGVSSAGRYQQTAVLFSTSSATVTTDKTDYAPGETVVITGTGWQPGETVTLNIHRDTNDPPDTVLSAVADANGNITNSEYVCQEFDLGVTFLLTATGQTSGYTAQTSFTDGSVKFTAAPNGVTLGVTPSQACTAPGAKCVIETTYKGTKGPGNDPDIPNTTCTGTADAPSFRKVTAGSFETNGVANNDGLRLEAPATSDQGGAFINWTTTNGAAFSFPVAGNTRIICAPANSVSNREYVATYECAAPVITTQPAPQTAECGTDVTFSVAATGTGLTYQWRKGGVAIAGATSSTLTLNSVTSANNGSYDVRVSGTCPTVTTIFSNAATLTVTDTTSPTITAPPAVTVNTGAGATSCSVVVSNATLGSATASDSCPPGTVTIVRTGVPAGNLFPLGNTTLTYTATDASGNTATATQTVTVVDNTPPTITPAANITVNTGPGATVCSVTVSTLGTPSTSDNCPGTVTVTPTGIPAGNVFPLGTTTITYTATDAAGNQTTATQTVTVVDNTPPTITPPANITVNTGPGATSCSVTVANLGTPSTSDNCPGTVTVTPTGIPAGNVFPLGTTTITYTATDANGNTSGPVTQTVTVIDNTPPTITPPANITVYTGPGATSCSVTVANLGTPSTSDNCPGTVTVTPTGIPAGNVFPLGTTTITYTATDANGNTSGPVTQTVTVIDNTPPVPSLASLPDVTGECSATVSSAPTATDNCAGALTGTTLDPLTYSTQGTFTVHWTYNDGHGNSATQNQSIIVKDVTPPTIAAPTNINVGTGPGATACGVTLSDLGTPVANDNCAGFVVDVLGVPAGNFFPIGTTTITYKITDVGGNIATATQTVTVTDTTPPTVTPPANITVNTGPGATVCSVTVASLGTPTANDNCPGVTVGVSGVPAGNVFPLGTTTITYTATDAAGNQTTATQTVTVVDNTPPVPSLASLPDVTGECSATVSSAPTATDNCAGALTGTTLDPLTYSTQGTFTVHWTYNDGHGNSATQNQSIIVKDVTPPTIAAPTNINAGTGPGATACGVTLSDLGTPVANDNCAGFVVDVLGVPAGNFFPIGTTTITYKITDVGGNIATATQTVTVTDTTPPTVTPPANITVNTGPGATVCSVTVASLGTPTANDNCPGVTVGVSGVPAGNVFPLGTTTITYTATDAAGNQTTATQTVTVVDNTPPVPNLASLPDVTGECSATVGSAPTATDNCAGAVTGTTTDPTTRSTQGTFNVTWTYNDGHGNSATQNQSIIVKDVTPPTIAAPTNINAGTGPGATACGVTLSDLGTPVANDNCAGFVVDVLGVPAGNFFPIGTTTITYKITDIGGNIATATQTVTVTDTTPPTVTPPANISVNTGPGATSCSVTVSDLGVASASDNCPGDVAIVPSGVPADNVFPVGTTTITYTATDVAGNASTATQTVTVVDNTPPTITAPPAVNAVTGPGATVCGTIVSNLGTPSANDNCPGVTTSVSGVPPGDLFPVGTTTVTYTATDAHGNTATATQTVTVVDTTPPTLLLTSPASAAVGAGCSASVPTVAYTAADNCTPVAIAQSPAAGTLVGPGNTVITVTATDGFVNSTMSRTTFTVTNAAPVISSVSGPSVPVQFGSPVSVTASFTDTEVQGHTCTFSWDDGSSTDVVVGPGVTTCSATHTYPPSPGVYTVGVTVSDDCTSASAAVPFEFVVVFDPNGGFVTGGGWINSPQGASTLYPLAIGKANFGFVSKYKKGSNYVPDGETEFQFKAGDLNFHSTAYDYGSLVVSGYKAQYRGTGTINGVSGFKFVLTAYDGQVQGGEGVDRFRMKIIRTADSTVVYDNKMGASEDIDSTPMAISGGSIVIHK